MSLQPKHPPTRPLKQSQSVLRLLFDANPLPMWIYDRQTLNFLEVNDAAEKEYGYSRAEFLRMKVTDLRPAEEVPRLLKYLTELQDGVQNEGVWKHITKDGAFLDVELITHAIHWGVRPAVLTVIHNITERKRMEETLHGTKERLDAATNNADMLLHQQSAAIRASMDGMAILNAKGEYVYLNEAHAKLYGYDRSEDLLGKTWRVLHDAAEIERIDNEIFPVLQKTGHWRGETVGKRKNGQSFPQEISLTAIEKGGLVCVVRDITDRQQMQEERNRLFELEKGARAKAEMVNRAKDEFLALVSHELRTPMAAMMGWAWLLRYGNPDAPTRERAFDVIERNMKLQAQISEDLLDISSIVTGKLKLNMSEVNLTPIIRSVMDVVRPTAETKCVKLECRINPPGGSIVLGDPDRLQQIFWNLLSNAIKFTPAEGKVVIAAEQDGNSVKVSVTDTGQGIDTDFLPYLFDPFHQEEDSMTRHYRGLGLGLAIVRHLVELHGGMIQALSGGPGKGATFSVKLPIVLTHTKPVKQEIPRKTSTADTPNGPLPMLEGIRVLLVDDAPDNCTIMKIILEQSGANVTAVSSAAEALQSLAASKPHVLVSDIMMPEEDGYSLIRKVRAMSPEKGGDIPAVALTACARIEDRTLALLAGFQIYVTKPVEPVELATVVASLVKRPSGKS